MNTKDSDKLIEKQKLLFELSSKYFDLPSEELSLQGVCDDLHALSEASYTILNLITPGKKTIKTSAISGIPKNLKKALKLFVPPLINKEWAINEEAISVFKNRSL